MRCWPSYTAVVAKFGGGGASSGCAKLEAEELEVVAQRGTNTKAGLRWPSLFCLQS